MVWFLLFINSAVILFSDTITGQWWRYNSGSQDFDELTIDNDLGFILKATIADRLESHEGQIYVIGGGYYYAHVDYNGTDKNCSISCGNDYTYMLFTLYENETDRIYGGWFDRRKVLPSGKLFEEDAKEEKRRFDFQPNFGTFGWSFNQSPDGQNEHLFSIEVYSLRGVYFPLGLGLEIVPFKFTYSFLTESLMMSFLNTRLDWNFFDFPLRIENTLHQYWFFGPTFAVNWLNLNDYKNLSVNNVIFDAGLKFSWGKSVLRNITIEAGYRNNAGSHGYYFSVLTDNYLPVYYWPWLFWGITQ